MISPSTIEEVRKLPIYDVVNRYSDIDLKKTGATYRAPSPFTNEKTPSFYVIPHLHIFKCFSSGKGGDGINFVMLKENLSWIDAVKSLCAQHNIQIQYESTGHTKEHYDRLEELYKINATTARQYVQALLEVDGHHPAFKELINKRRFSADTILQWGIGYAPADINQYTPSKWNFIAQKLISTGNYQHGIDLGLIKTKGDVTYDTFRHRIIYPIHDHYGRCLGFGGRALHTDEYNAKYINSPESDVYKKSHVLFGLHHADAHIRKAGYANLMEGYTDVISFHQAGFCNTVGTCGTALTVDQASLLRKYTNKVVLVYDPDEAGQKAALRAIDLLMKEGFQVSVLPLPSIVELKREAPTKKNPNPQPWREPVFITQRTTEAIWCNHRDAKGRLVELELDAKEVAAIEKVDPDELVRMF